MSEQCDSPGELHVAPILPASLPPDLEHPAGAPLRSSRPARTPGSPSVSTGNASPPASFDRLSSVENPALDVPPRIELNTGLVPRLRAAPSPSSLGPSQLAGVQPTKVLK